MTTAHIEAARQPGPDRQSGRPAQATPPFGLTLRAMNVGMRYRPAPSAGRFAFLLVSVIALALACFPVLAHAEDSSGVQYSDAIPKAEGENTPTHHHQQTPAKSSSTDNGGGDSALPLVRIRKARRKLKDLVKANHLRKEGGVAAVKHDGGGTGQGNPGGSANGGAQNAVHSAGQKAPPATNVAVQRQRRLLAARPDPDRNCRARCNLGGGRDDQAAAPAPRADRNGLPRGELTMVKQRKRPLGQVRAWMAAIAVSASAWQQWRRRRWRSPATSGASHRRQRRTPNSSSACATAGSTACGSRFRGARCSRPVPPTPTSPTSTRSSRVPPRRGSTCCPSSTTLLPGRSPRPAFLAALRVHPRPSRSRPGRSAPPGPTSSSWSSVATAPTGLSGRLIPACRKARFETWQIWNEENFKYFVVRPSPSDYGKLINVSYTAIKSVDPGCQADPRRDVRPSQGGGIQSASRHRPTSPPTSSTRLYTSTPGVKQQVRRRRPASVHDQVPAADAGHRRIPHRAQSQPRSPARSSGSRRSAGARNRSPRATRSPKARRARRPS